ncbi:MAG: hypothetical protein ABI467_31440, partial [Kofleriaceae bacterium]
SAVVPNLPRGLDQVVLRALAKHPAQRFPTAHAMLDAIEEVAEAAGVSITSNVLRRYMRDLFGTREEPWRELERAMIPMLEDSDIELVEDSQPRALAGLPLDAVAESVPLLDEGTGMIDLAALLATQPPRDSRPNPPASIPTGSILMVPLPVPNARRARQTSHVRVATGSADGVPYPVRRTLDTAAVRRPPTIATVLITAVGVVAIATIVYVLVVHDGRPSPASVSGSGASAVAPPVTPLVPPIEARGAPRRGDQTASGTPAAAMPAVKPAEGAAAAPAELVAEPEPATAARPVAKPEPVTAPAKPVAKPEPVAAAAKPIAKPDPVPAIKPVAKLEPVKPAGAAAAISPVGKPADKPAAKPAAKPADNKKDTCSDPLDCQY